MLSCQSRGLRYTLAGYSLMVAVAGCQFHRTGHGFVLRSQWSLECDNSPRLTFGPQKDQQQRQLTDQTADRPAAKPEVLPWRSRLKGYRLAARIFGRNGPGGSAGRAGSGPPFSPGLATGPPPLPPPPEEPNDGKPASPSAGLSELQLPGNILLAPEPRPPKLAVD